MTLQIDVIGTWSLVSYQIDFLDCTHEAPYGALPIGLLHYETDGFMCAHLMAPGRPLLNCDSNQASGDAARTALATHISYAGSYRIDGQTITHMVTICTLQDMVGLELLRQIEVKNRRLTLTPPQMTFGGKRGSAVLVWKRAERSEASNDG